MTDKLRMLRLIWVALLFGVLTYTTAAFVLLVSGALSSDVLDESILRFIVPVVVVYMATGLLVRRRMLAGIPADAPDEMRAQRYQAATIVALAVMESGGLAVVTLGVLAGAATWVLAGGGASIWMMIMARPRAEELIPKS